MNILKTLDLKFKGTDGSRRLGRAPLGKNEQSFLKAFSPHPAVTSNNFAAVEMKSCYKSFPEFSEGWSKRISLLPINW